MWNPYAHPLIISAFSQYIFLTVPNFVNTSLDWVEVRIFDPFTDISLIQP